MSELDLFRSIALATFFCVALAGYGTIGATKRFVLPIAPSIVEGIERGIHAGGVAVADDANVVIAAGTMPWGAFEESDRSNFENSLEQTLGVLDQHSTDVSLPPWSVEVLLRRHVIAHDNTSAGLLVCVAWTLKTETGEVVYQNRFYGAGSRFLFSNAIDSIFGTAVATSGIWAIQPKDAADKAVDWEALGSTGPVTFSDVENTEGWHLR